MAQRLVGRPKCDIDTEQAAELMFELHLSATTVARMLDVSRQTLYNHMEEAGLSITENRFSHISDDQLEREMRTITDHPNAGEVYVAGHLRSRSIFVPRRRIRQMMYFIDPEGVERRLTHTVVRRVYSVPCPNYLWHIDGDHKLINWKFVIHAAIDGFSRNIVYLHCANNNRASTVEERFMTATEQYGWPVRVRTDYGGENVGVWNQMCAYRGADRKPVIAGSSVHNSRVERMHKDVNIQICHTFKDQFLGMEANGILDRSNDTDLFCLHYVFLPKINKALTEFRNAHNHHSVSTEHNQTPIQLFHLNQHRTASYENNDSGDPHPGVSVADLRRCDLPHVHVEPIACPLSRPDMRELKSAIDPDAVSPEDAITKYKRVSCFVSRCLTRM